MIWQQALDEIRQHVEALERDLAEADAMIAKNSWKIDPRPKDLWPEASVARNAVRRHAEREVERLKREYEENQRASFSPRR